MSPEAAIRLLALDIDGTLVTRGNVISQATRQALHRAHAAGLELVICTGRRYRTTRIVIDALGLPLAAVCLGGALVKQPDGATLDARAFSPEGFREATSLVRNAGFVAIAQRDAHGLGGADFLIDGARPWDRWASAYHGRHAAHAEWRRDLAAEPRDDVLVVGAFGVGEALEALAERIETRGGGRYRCHVMAADALGAHYCEIVPSEVDKWSALRAFADGLGVERDAICAVGDGVNDVSMIREAGWGVAMGNAHGTVLGCADWVTGRHDEDGLVALVERLLEAAPDGPGSAASPARP